MTLYFLLCPPFTAVENMLHWVRSRRALVLGTEPHVDLVLNPLCPGHSLVLQFKKMDSIHAMECSLCAMNIFFLSLHPVEAARLHCDKHVVKMIIETAQLLYTAHWVYESPLLEGAYRKTHPNHPSAVWVRESLTNYNWLCQLGIELCAEYTYRYEKIHKTLGHLHWLADHPPSRLIDIGWTLPRLAMPDEFKHNDPVIAYQQYYAGAKVRLLSYRKRPMPAFLAQAVYMTAGGKSIPAR